MRSTLRRVGFALAAAGLASGARAAPLTFRNYASSSSPVLGTQFFEPAINDNGVVAFSASLDAGGTGIFKSDGTTLTMIAQTGSTFSSFGSRPGINNAGTVVFQATRTDGSSGLFTGNGGSITTVADTTSTFSSFQNQPTINSNGVVATSATLTGGQTGIFTFDGATTTWIATSIDAAGYTAFGPYAPINSTGKTAFSAARLYFGSFPPSTNLGIYTKDAVNPATTVASFDPISGIQTIASPSISNNNDVAFAARFGTSDQIYRNGSAFVTTSGPFAQFDESVVINDNGMIAFDAGLDNGKQGIYFGTDPVKNKVIEVGDPLFGSTLSDWFFSRGLDNRNEVAFNYVLSNGVEGIAVVAIPEPGFTLGMLSFASLLLTRRRASRGQRPRAVRMRSAFSVFSAAVFALGGVQSAHAAPIYHVTDLGTLGGGYSYASAINAQGQIVGESRTDYGAVHTFLYSAGTMTDLGTIGGGLPIGLFSTPYAINSSGQITGWSQVAGSQHAFRYSGGVMADLGTLGGGGSFGYGINASGQVVGYSDTTSSDQHAFLYSGGSMTDLGTLGGRWSYARGINDSGQIVGYSYAAGAYVQHAFLYSGGVMTDLGTLGGPLSDAYGINNSGQIVGDAYTVSGPNHAFLYTNGIMKDLGALEGPSSVSVAWNVNDLGQVVGWSHRDSLGVDHAFVYSDGSMKDLNDLLDSSGTGWTLTDARGINNSGWIVGYGTNPAGQGDAFLLTPAPEPAALGLLLVIGSLGFLRHRRRRAARHVAGQLSTTHFAREE